MLDTSFPRIIGDVGNPDSYDFSTRTCIVDGAGSLDIVKDGLPTNDIIADFCVAAQKLESQGAIGIISSCGFLVSVQDQIANAVKIPVMLSALSLYKMIKSEYGNKPIGILTASSVNLGDTALRAAGINREDVRIAGMEDCPPFVDAILRPKQEQILELDQCAISKAVVLKTQKLIKRDPEIVVFILECGNLPPYAQAITSATGLPVYSILNVAENLIQIFEKE